MFMLDSAKLSERPSREPSKIFTGWKLPASSASVTVFQPSRRNTWTSRGCPSLDRRSCGMPSLTLSLRAIGQAVDSHELKPASQLTVWIMNFPREPFGLFNRPLVPLVAGFCDQKVALQHQRTCIRNLADAGDLSYFNRPPVQEREVGEHTGLKIRCVGQHRQLERRRARSDSSGVHQVAQDRLSPPIFRSHE